MLILKQFLIRSISYRWVDIFGNAVTQELYIKVALPIESPAMDWTKIPKVEDAKADHVLVITDALTGKQWFPVNQEK